MDEAERLARLHPAYGSALTGRPATMPVLPKYWKVTRELTLDEKVARDLARIDAELEGIIGPVHQIDFVLDEYASIKKRVWHPGFNQGRRKKDRRKHTIQWVERQQQSRQARKRR